MDMKRIKLHVVLISFILVLVLGLVGQSYIHQSRVVEPLVRDLKDVYGVEEVSFVKAGRMVQVRLSDDAYLAETVPTVQRIIQSYGDFSLVLLDKPTPSAQRAFQHMMFVVEEAVAQGSFQSMEAGVKEIAEEYGLSLTIALDRSYIYLQLSEGADNDEGQLIRVISRGSAPAIQTIAQREVTA